MKNNNDIKIGSNRSFGFVFCAFFLIIAVYPLTIGENPNYWLIILSLVFLILALSKASILSPLNKLWFKFGLLLGNIISPIVMGIVFFIIITPISLIMKILGKDLLNLDKNKNNTYWIEKTGPKSTMKNQF
mgnify:FL=1